MSTLTLTHELALADLLETAASTISVDTIRRSKTGTHTRSEFRRVYNSIAEAFEEAGFTRENIPDYASFAVDGLLEAAKGTSFRSDRLTSSQLLFKAARRLEAAITNLRDDA